MKSLDPRVGAGKGLGISRLSVDLSHSRSGDCGTLLQEWLLGNSLVVQWLGFHALSAKGPGSIPGRGSKIPQAMRCGQKKEKKKGVVSLSFMLFVIGSIKFH